MAAAEVRTQQVMNGSTPRTSGCANVRRVSVRLLRSGTSGIIDNPEERGCDHDRHPPQRRVPDRQRHYAPRRRPGHADYIKNTMITGAASRWSWHIRWSGC